MYTYLYMLIYKYKHQALPTHSFCTAALQDVIYCLWFSIRLHGFVYISTEGVHRWGVCPRSCWVSIHLKCTHSPRKAEHISCRCKADMKHKQTQPTGYTNKCHDCSECAHGMTYTASDDACSCYIYIYISFCYWIAKDVSWISIISYSCDYTQLHPLAIIALWLITLT